MNNGEEAEVIRGKTAADATAQGNLTDLIQRMKIVSDGHISHYMVGSY
jgi:hypothetical protein